MDKKVFVEEVTKYDAPQVEIVEVEVEIGFNGSDKDGDGDATVPGMGGFN